MTGPSCTPRETCALGPAAFAAWVLLCMTAGWCAGVLVARVIAGVKQ